MSCDKCGHSGQIHRDRLIETYGPGVTMPDLRHLIADCPRREIMSDPRGIYCADVAHG